MSGADEQDHIARAAAAIDDPDARRETIAYDAAGIRLTPYLPPRPVNTPPSAQETAPRAVDPLREALEAYDAFMSGKPIGPDTKAMADRASLAAAFAAAAYEKGYDRGQATHALLRSFLTAMLDPASPDLDYLRAVNQQPILAAAPQPAPVGREALVEVIVRGMARSAANSSMVGPIADALIAAGLRLPGPQPDETLAWAVVQRSGTLAPYLGFREPPPAQAGERVVRVAIRRVEDEA